MVGAEDVCDDGVLSFLSKVGSCVLLIVFLARLLVLKS